MLKFFNTLGKKKMEFRPIEKGKVKFYSCGPTIYNYAHIGNWRSFVFSDIVRRYLEYLGYEVFHVSNLTDVDDKTIKGAINENASLRDYTEKYEKIFFSDMKKLNIEKPHQSPRATEHIKEMVELIQKLKKNGHTYEADGSVYYSIKSFADYGKLSGVELDKIVEGASGRIDSQEYEKEDAKDFILWKKAKEGEEKIGAVWETPFGKGRPGWHIECSAMSMKFMGETFDIHTGGIDLIFPHHENEIAQSEGATEKPFVNYWLHCAHLFVEGKKMSKSKGNFYTLEDLIKKGYSARSIRYLLLSAHYRSQLNFTESGIKQADESIKRIDEFMERLQDVKGIDYDIEKELDVVKQKFEDALNDDLNMPNALSAIFEFIKKTNKLIDEGKISKENSIEINEQIKKFDKVLGIIEMKEEKDISEEEKKMIEERENARKNKDYSKADEIREKLKERGIILKDTEQGVKWSRG